MKVSEMEYPSAFPSPLREYYRNIWDLIDASLREGTPKVMRGLNREAKNHEKACNGETEE